MFTSFPGDWVSAQSAGIDPCPCLPRRSKEKGLGQVKGLIYIGSFVSIHLWNRKLQATKQTHLPRLNEGRLYIHRHMCYLQTLDYSKQKVHAHLQTHICQNECKPGGWGVNDAALCRCAGSGSAQCLKEHIPGFHKPHGYLNGSCSGLDERAKA